MRSQALLEELKWRDLLFQYSEQVSGALDRGPLTGYAGFDPTAPSLHVGSLVPVMGLVLSCVGLSIIADAIYQHEFNKLA